MKLIDNFAECPKPQSRELPDIKPQTPISSLNRSEFNDAREIFEIRNVSIAVGMQETFIRKICGRKKTLSPEGVLNLLEQVEKTLAKLAKGKQFNRKVEINATLRRLKNELEQLSR